MIDFVISLRRSWSFGWQNVISVETVKAYKKSLEKKLILINQSCIPKVLQCHPDIEQSVKEALTEEIKYCDFYIEYEKAKERKNFNKWVMTKPKNFLPYDWMWEYHNEALVKRNGRRKAIIEVNSKKGVMKRISLIIKNDSKVLEFVERQTEMLVKHLSSDQSIEDYVNKLKQEADSLLADPLPKYVGNEHKLLLALLQAEELR